MFQSCLNEFLCIEACCRCRFALDRKEKGLAERSAIQELAATLEVPVRALVDIDDLISYLAESSPEKDATQLAKMQHYRAQYGV